MTRDISLSVCTQLSHLTVFSNPEKPSKGSDQTHEVSSRGQAHLGRCLVRDDVPKAMGFLTQNPQPGSLESCPILEKSLNLSRGHFPCRTLHLPQSYTEDMNNIAQRECAHISTWDQGQEERPPLAQNAHPPVSMVSSGEDSAPALQTVTFSLFSSDGRKREIVSLVSFLIRALIP